MPERVLAAALDALRGEGVKIRVVSPTLHSAPLGPSRRRYANAAAVIEANRGPDALLDLLKGVERRFGRRAGGQRWGSRVLDLDIVLWDGGAWSTPGLTIPHVAFRCRGFVLAPATAVAPRWRDPVTGLSLRQLHARLTRPRRVPR
ncbi:MAG: 2-amino-4-hydroxy-6-hydroxymethyldihydropteridine diphosphokinase [Novosphingobium sp.]